MLTSKTPLSPATDSSLTAALTLRVLTPDRVLQTPELDSLIGLKGGLLSGVSRLSCSNPRDLSRASVLSIGGSWDGMCLPLRYDPGTCDVNPLLFVPVKVRFRLSNGWASG